MNAVMTGSMPVSTQDAALKLKKAHIKLMRHPETCLYAGVILMGESSVDVGVPTAYTDGLNKRYGKEFLDKLDMPETCGLVMHENLHVLLKHIPRHKDLMRKNARLANVAMDFVVNDIIVELSKKDPALIKLPEGALYDPKYHDWSVRQVWDDLIKNMPPEDGRGEGGDTDDSDGVSDGSNGGQGGQKGRGGYEDLVPLDEHDPSLSDEMDEEAAKKLSDDITDAINQGSIIAGRFGAKIPRAIKDVLKPRVDWREELREFVTEATSGRTDYSWRRLNRKQLVNDLFMPSVESERIGEGVMANDTSGSIGDDLLSMVGAEVASICDMCNPDRIRILWWDTKVHGEQVFEENYEGIASMLKPVGGGGTRLSCVSDYVRENNMTPAFMIVFTDGYVEYDVQWDVSCPVLWLLPPEHNADFNPPSGRKIVVEV